ncbi:hypothetical protein KUV62_15750 [Salipiger bermudensis]|nr:hypothetical protein [Salipiger bermudensis]MBY6005379.1 hypothetical protein [Salipiger bermudensis]
MAEKKNPPEWGYRIADGKIEAKLFPEGRPPRGWADTPAGMAEKIEKAEK